MLTAYLAAESALLLGKEARLGDRSLRMEDLSEIRKGRQEWEARVKAEEASAATAPSIGGLSFKLAQMDNDR